MNDDIPGLLNIPTFISPLSESFMELEGYSENDKTLCREFRENGYLFLDNIVDNFGRIRDKVYPSSSETAEYFAYLLLLSTI